MQSRLQSEDMRSYFQSQYDAGSSKRGDSRDLRNYGRRFDAQTAMSVAEHNSGGGFDKSQYMMKTGEADLLRPSTYKDEQYDD